MKKKNPSDAEAALRQKTEEQLPVKSNAQDEKVKQYIANITLLSEAALKYVSISRDENIYDYIRDVLRNLTGAKYIIVNSYNKRYNLLTTESFYADKTINIKITKLLGKKAVGYTIKPDTGIINELLRKKNLQVAGGLFELSGEKIPYIISRSLEGLLNVEKVFAMGFSGITCNSWGESKFKRTIFLT